MIQKITADEVKSHAKANGLSHYESKKQLERRNLERAISDLPFESVELKEILRAILKTR